jgi:hypothetical protein
MPDEDNKGLHPRTSPFLARASIASRILGSEARRRPTNALNPTQASITQQRTLDGERAPRGNIL